MARWGRRGGLDLGPEDRRALGCGHDPAGALGIEDVTGAGRRTPLEIGPPGLVVEEWIGRAGIDQRRFPGGGQAVLTGEEQRQRSDRE